MPGEAVETEDSALFPAVDNGGRLRWGQSYRHRTDSQDYKDSEDSQNSQNSQNSQDL